MKPLALLPLSLLLLAPALSPPASAIVVPDDGLALALALAGDGCENYGNQVHVASQHVCKGGGDCENYGNQVHVASTVECDGSCPNHGVRVAVASTVCGRSGTEACVGNRCLAPPMATYDVFVLGSGPFATSVGAPGLDARGGSPVVVATFADCIPHAQWGGDMHPSIHLVCDPSGHACGINAEPVCWTFRFACMNALILVLRVYDNLIGQGHSTCEGQPGWSGGAVDVAVLPSAAAGSSLALGSDAALLARLAKAAGDGCENYGNQVEVGSHRVCRGGGDCENYGNQVYVGSRVDCDGACPNHGVRVAVGSRVCGRSGTEACVGDKCVRPAIVVGTEGTAPAAAASAAGPQPARGSDGPHCDGYVLYVQVGDLYSCWTTPLPAERVAAETALVSEPAAEPADLVTVALLDPDVVLAGSDCIPKPRLHPFIQFYCDRSGQACGANGQPVCWTFRFVCMNALILVLRVYDNLAGRGESTCEGQPGWTGGAAGPAVAQAEAQAPWHASALAPSQAAAVRAAFADCVPSASLGGGFPPALHAGCDPSGNACGINGEPVCWAFRFACMNALILVLRVYDRNTPEIIPIVGEDSMCEGQPGWQGTVQADGGGAVVGAGLASGDCLPEVSFGPAGSVYLTCDPSGQPCGINGQPVCWTSRFACMNALILALRVYDRKLMAPDKASRCEGQPGWSPAVDVSPWPTSLRGAGPYDP